MKHLTKNELYEMHMNAQNIDFVQQKKEHLLKCESCNKKYYRINKILSASDNSSFIPPENCKHKILNTYHNRNTAISNKKSFKFSTKALSAAAAVALAITTIITLYLSETFQEKSIIGSTLQLDSLNNQIILNGHSTIGIKNISQGDKIHIPEKKFSQLGINELFEIKLSANSILEIKDALANEENNHFTHNFIFKQGMLFANFQKNKARNEYSFTTPQIRIDSIGTSFILFVSKKKTTLYLATGKLRITVLKSGKILQCQAGNTYEIKNNIVSIKMQTTTMARVQSMKHEEASKLNDYFNYFRADIQIHKKKIRKTIKKKIKADNSNSTNDDSLERMKRESREIQKTMRKTNDMSREGLQEMRQHRNRHRKGKK